MLFPILKTVIVYFSWLKYVSILIHMHCSILHAGIVIESTDLFVPTSSLFQSSGIYSENILQVLELILTLQLLQNTKYVIEIKISCIVLFITMENLVNNNEDLVMPCSCFFYPKIKFWKIIRTVICLLLIYQFFNCWAFYIFWLNNVSQSSRSNLSFHHHQLERLSPTECHIINIPVTVA